MIRKGATIASEVILVLLTFACLAMIAVWVASSFRLLRWEVVNRTDALFIVAVIDGHTELHWDYFTNLGGDDEQSFQQRNENLKSDIRRIVPEKRRGFYVTFLQRLPTSPTRFYSYRYREIGFDIWLPVLLLATAPTWFLIRYSIGPLRRNRRSKLGLCLNCGYDLTGNVSGVCPECGSEVGQA